MALPPVVEEAVVEVAAVEEAAVEEATAHTAAWNVSVLSGTIESADGVEEVDHLAVCKRRVHLRSVSYHLLSILRLCLAQTQALVEGCSTHRLR